MASRRVSRSEGFYCDLNQYSTADCFETVTSKRGKLFEVERVVSSKIIRKKTYYLCRWKSYGPLTDSWEPEENLNEQALSSFQNPKVTDNDLRSGEEALGLGILSHLRSKHGDSDTSTAIEMRHDVFNKIFRGKGRFSQRKGWQEFDFGDFSRCRFPCGWDKWVDHLGDGKKINFPVLAKPFLQWGPKSYSKNADGQMVLLPRYYREKVRICFSTSAYSLN